MRPTVAALSRSGRLAVPGRSGPRWFVPYAYVLPGVVAYFVLAFIPLAQTAWVSLHEWDGVSTPIWVGIDNYRALAEDSLVRNSFLNVLILMIFHSFLPVAIGLFLAAIITRAPLRGVSSFRVILFLPYTISLVVVAIAWQWIYAPQGAPNTILEALGLGGLARAWLGDFTFALPAVGLAATWVTFGFPMVLFLAGVSRIPGSLYDAARIDGAGAVREFFAVTLPALRNELVIAFGFTIVTTLRSFALVYVMTGGGPGNETRVPAIEIYERGFIYFQAGSAAAVGVALTVMIFLVVVALTRLFERGEE